MDPRKLLAEVDAAQRQLEDGVFRSPPANMEQFNSRLGQWLGLNMTRDLVMNAIAKEQDEEDKDPL